MKTYTISNQKLSLLSLFGLLIFATSCGSYKNSSYYDNDGVYGGTAQKIEANQDKDYENNAYYKEYFSNLNKENNEQVFTDVENYSSNDGDAQNQTEYNGNTSWGSNPSSITVNYYGSNWGYSYWNNNWYNNWAWNSWGYPSYYTGWNSWYGPSWGWGYNNYWYGGYYGYNPYFYGYYPYYYNNYYGYPYGNHYAYGGGRREGRMSNGYNNFNGGRAGYSTGTRNNGITAPRSNTSTPRSYNNTPRSTTTPRSYDAPRNTTSTPRSYNNTPRNNTNTTQQNGSYSTPRPQVQVQTPRTYEAPRSIESTPRTYEAPRSSSSSSGSFGGGSSSGGGRSSGGGGGRR